MPLIYWKMTITQYGHLYNGNNFSVGANLFNEGHEDGLVDDVVAQSIDKLHYS